MSTWDVISGAVIAGLFGVVAYFLQRLVSQNDDFQDETRRNFKNIGQELEYQRIATANLKFALEQKISETGIDPATKGKISSLLQSVAQVEKDLLNVKPSLDKVEDSNGKIIWIVSQLEAQEQKLAGLYKVMVKIVNSQKH